MACPPYFLRLALLASPIVDVIFAGKAPWTLSLTELDTTLPYSETFRYTIVYKRCYTTLSE